MVRRKARGSTRVLGWTLLVGLLILPGCQFHYEYEVRGTIKDFTGGTPLAGVRISLEGSGLDGVETPVTGSDGSFLLRFSVGDIEFLPDEMPKWSLSLAKEGYADEVIDISPSKEPESSRIVNVIVLQSYMGAK